MKTKTIGFKNSWKMYSHSRRSHQGQPTIDEFRNYVEFRNKSILEESERITPPSEIFSSVNDKTEQHWQVLFNVVNLNEERRSLLSSQCKSFVDNHDNEEIYNKMVQSRHELARLIEMVQAENFRYEFMRQSLTFRTSSVKQASLDQILTKNSGNYARKVLISNMMGRLRYKDEAKIARRKRLSDNIDSLMAEIERAQKLKFGN